MFDVQKANEGVPTDIKKFEEQRQESYTLQARALHLRNQLYRQRRIRALNEKMFTATTDRSARVESLVAEMRTDLKSLKNRLDEELKELGIDNETAEGILKEYFTSQHYAEGYEEEDVEDLSPKVCHVSIQSIICMLKGFRTLDQDLMS